MTLSQEDAQLYYQLWRPLLEFVNKRYQVNTKLKNIVTEESLDPAEVKKVADRLWSDIEIIDLYLKENPGLPEDHKNIVRSWKRRVCRKFIIERHLKKGSIFISMENEEVYQVSGIISSWEEMFYGAPMPLMVEATLLPFRDVIISDGLVMTYNIMIGSGMKQILKNTYMTAKKDDRIHRSI